MYGLTGVVGSDNVTASGTATFATANVGTGIIVTVTGLTLGGAQAGDYTLSGTTASTAANITARPLTPSITAANKTYDGTTAANVMYGLTGIVGTDNVTAGGTATFATANVGTGIAVTATGITLAGAGGQLFALHHDGRHHC